MATDVPPRRPDWADLLQQATPAAAAVAEALMEKEFIARWQLQILARQHGPQPWMEYFAVMPPARRVEFMDRWADIFEPGGTSTETLEHLLLSFGLIEEAT